MMQLCYAMYIYEQETKHKDKQVIIKDYQKVSSDFLNNMYKTNGGKENILSRYSVQEVL